MDDQQRARILYLDALRHLDDEQRGIKNLVRYWAIFPLIVLALAALAVLMVAIANVPIAQGITVMIGVVPVAGITHVTWTNAHDDRIAAAMTRALELRIAIGETRPAESRGSKAGDELEDRLAHLHRQIGDADEPAAIEADSPTPQPEKGT